jgi:hypothetical protein
MTSCLTRMSGQLLAAILFCGGVAVAQQQSTTPAAAPCASAGASAEAATPPGAGGQHGTAPGSAGSTGWTGGLGGSYIGTAPAGPNPSSPTRHPEVARGLDPLKSQPQQQAAAC